MSLRLPRRCGRSAWLCRCGSRLFRIEQYEGRRRALGGDRRAVVLRGARLNLDLADVDDARELAHALQERPQIVIVARELQTDRPFRVQLLLRDGVRRES